MDIVVSLALLLSLLFIGTPIFVALGASGLIGLYLGKGPIALSLIPSSVIGQLNSFELIAIPLFILMGNLLAATPIGTILFEGALRWLGRLRGSLAICSVGACTIFGAISGVSVAGVAAVGSVVVPQMVDHGYSPRLAAGAVVSAGAIAMLIPPSVPFIIYGAISGESIGALFIGGIVPGLAMALALSLYIYVRAVIRPADAPLHVQRYSWRERLQSILNAWHVLFLIVAVLGSIYVGIATPSEAAAFGVAGAFLIAFWFGVRSLRKLGVIVLSSVRISCAILIIMGCAKIFGDYLNFIRVPELIASYATGPSIPPFVTMLVIMGILIVLGMLIDGTSLIIVTTPIFLPVITALGYDPLWFGIIMVLSLEIAVVTPPVGLNLYTLHSIYPRLSVEEIIKGSIPFILVQTIVMLIFLAFPALSLWLPSTMLG